jgi:hypothetical protein
MPDPWRAARILLILEARLTTLATIAAATAVGMRVVHMDDLHQVVRSLACGDLTFFAALTSIASKSAPSL